MKMDIDTLRSVLDKNEQGQILEFWEKLNNDQQQALYSDASSIDFHEVAKSFESATQQMLQSNNPVDEKICPVPADLYGSSSLTDADTLKSYWDAGLKSISEGSVAVLLLAGGQGTRLGVDYPKGQYDVGLISHKSLFQLQAERIIRLQKLALTQYKTAGKITWYIMTSGSTKESTVAFFDQHDYFGLDVSQVMFFEQGTLPCLSFDGKILMETPHKIARAPDGNGGLYSALKKADVLSDMEGRGVKMIHVYCVDNILVRPADPTFIGFCSSKGAECAAKVCEKTEPTEPVGVVCVVDGLYKVVEYSEISAATSERRGADGRLTFRAGNIANHFFTLDFLKRVCLDDDCTLVYHVAKKKIPVVDASSPDLSSVKPDSPNGIKMEKFVFDVFQFAKSFAVWEVPRQSEFSPLKNAAGGDSAATCRAMLYSEHVRWVKAAGGQVRAAPGAGGDCHLQGVQCELSPLVSYQGEGLKEICDGKTFLEPLLIGGDKEKSFMTQ